VESPSLEIFQPRLAAVLCSLLWVTLLGQGVGLGDPQTSLPTPTTLWFCGFSATKSRAIPQSWVHWGWVPGSHQPGDAGDVAWPWLLTPVLPGAGAEPDVAHRDAAAGELPVHHQAGEAAAAADQRAPQAAEQEQVGPGATRGPPQPRGGGWPLPPQQCGCTLEGAWTPPGAGWGPWGLAQPLGLQFPPAKRIPEVPGWVGLGGCSSGRGQLRDPQFHRCLPLSASWRCGCWRWRRSSRRSWQGPARRRRSCSTWWAGRAAPSRSWRSRCWLPAPTPAGSSASSSGSSSRCGAWCSWSRRVEVSPGGVRAAGELLGLPPAKVRDPYAQLRRWVTSPRRWALVGIRGAAPSPQGRVRGQTPSPAPTNPQA